MFANTGSVPDSGRPNFLQEERTLIFPARMTGAGRSRWKNLMFFFLIQTKILGAKFCDRSQRDRWMFARVEHLSGNLRYADPSDAQNFLQKKNINFPARMTGAGEALAGKSVLLLLEQTKFWAPTDSRSVTT